MCFIKKGLNKIKKIIDAIFYFIFSTKYEKILKKIEKNNVVSFDIFDTLIKRNVKNPTDIFDLVEREYNKSFKKIANFKAIRTNAEKRARKIVPFEDVTLEEIYQNMKEYTSEQKNILMKMELEIEKDFCTANTLMLPIFNKCIENKKRIFLISDMYLPVDVIRKILRREGYSGYKKIYLSSEMKLSKRTGNIFKKVINENNLHRNEMVHIGDAPIGDFLMPKKYGIDTILIKRKIKNSLFNSKENNEISYNILSSFINNNEANIIKETELSKYGYEVLGPLLYGFTSWLHNEIKKDKIKKLYFLARDAKLIMNIYQMRYNDDVKSYYLNISRKSILNSKLDKIHNFDSVYSNYKSILKKTSNILDFFYILDLDYKEYEQKLNINLDKYIMDLSNDEKSKIFNLIKLDLEKKMLVQNKYLKEYLKQNDMKGKVAIIDVGWNGTIQHNIAEILNTKANIRGYYYGVNNNPKYLEYEKDERKGFLFDLNNRNSNQTTIELSSGLFEIMFFTSEGTTISYKSENGKIVACLGDAEHSKDNVNSIMQMQDMAKQFVKDMINSNVNKYMSDCPNNVYFENYKQIVNNPKNKYIKLFKNINFENFKTTKLIDNKNLIYYVFKPKKLYVDFINSNCKIMFLKAIFKLKFPYFKILQKIIKIRTKKMY